MKLMPPTLYRSAARLLLIAAFGLFMSGCGATLSPVKRKPVQVSSLETSLPSSGRKILVRFASTLPGKPLAETVWDNVSGAFADAEESRQIGFTQNYSKLVAAAAAGAVIGGPVGGGVGGAVVGKHPSYTRIVIPFGRIFQGVFESGLQNTFPNSLTCSDDACELEKLKSAEPTRVVRLRVAEFQVWEEPLNHINLRAMVECKVHQAGLTNKLDYIFEARDEATKQSIGSVMTTSAGFIKEMNKISNRFAGALSEEILKKLQEKLGD